MFGPELMAVLGSEKPPIYLPGRWEVLSVDAGMDIADRLEETNRKNLELRKVMVKSLEENVATEHKKWRMSFVQKWHQLSQLAEEESRENAERVC